MEKKTCNANTPNQTTLQMQGRISMGTDQRDSTELIDRSQTWSGVVANGVTGRWLHAVCDA